MLPRPRRGRSNQTLNVSIEGSVIKLKVSKQIYLVAHSSAHQCKAIGPFTATTFPGLKQSPS